MQDEGDWSLPPYFLSSLPEPVELLPVLDWVRTELTLLWISSRIPNSSVPVVRWAIGCPFCWSLVQRKQEGVAQKHLHGAKRATPIPGNPPLAVTSPGRRCGSPRGTSAQPINSSYLHNIIACIPDKTSLTSFYRARIPGPGTMEGGKRGFVSNHLEYLVDWEGYGPDERSVHWDDILDLTLLTTFHESHPQSLVPRGLVRPLPVFYGLLTCHT